MRVDSNAFLSACGTFTSQIGGKVIQGYRCKYRVAAYHDCLFDCFVIAFPPQLGNAAAKRRSGYLAGRFCAQRLLKLLGFNAAQCDIPIGANREPIWPAGVVASISHSADLAVCIATTQPDVLGLGIDVEKEMPADMATNIKQQVLDAEEDTVIRSHFDAYNQGLTIVFSGKESVYKAVYPLVGRFFDFSAIKLVHVDANRMVFSVAESLSECFRVGVKISVTYKIANADILTITCLTRRCDLHE
jgi:enterobactin synthetase component D